MKKTVYLCDCCGPDCCGPECQPAKVRLADAYGGVAITDGKRYFIDVCVSCLSGLYAVIVVTATRYRPPIVAVDTTGKIRLDTRCSFGNDMDSEH